MDKEEILTRIKELQPSYLREWNPDIKDAGWAVSEVFAAMMSELYTQFDKVPDKLIVAYLDKLGYSLNPPLPAFAPVTFTLSENCKRAVTVPRLTELESKSKVKFETMESFTASPAKLAALVDIRENRYVTDHSASLDTSGVMELFSTTESDNYLYFGDDHLFNIHKKVNTAVGLNFTVPEIKNGEWEYYGHQNKEGEPDWISFQEEGSTRLDKSLPYKSIKTKVNGVSSYWIRVKTDEAYASGIFKVNFRSRSNIDALFHNTTPLDHNKTFHPFGYQPQINDLLYIASEEAFSKKGFEVEVYFDKEGGAGNAYFSDHCFGWEYWNGESWNTLPSNPFHVPDDISPTTVNGEENYWVRVRVLDNSSFGMNSDYEYVNQPEVSKISIEVKHQNDGVIPQYCYNYKNMAFFKPGSQVSETDEDEAALYFGFDRSFGEGLISLYVKMADAGSGEKRSLHWQYHSEEGWSELNVKDGSNAFEQSGYIQFIAPGDQEAAELFSKRCYWIRAVFDEAVEGRALEALYLNTIEARQSKTLDVMPLGSSDGSGFQRFSLTDTNLFDVKLWVLESELPEGYEGYKDRFGEGYWVLWNAVDQLYHAGSNERVYRLNAYLGEISFGDDRNGKIPPMGEENILVSYAVGGGTEGNVAAMQIDSMVDTVAFIDSMVNPIDATGGADMQTIGNLMSIAPKRFKHRYRAVAQEDYSYLVQEASSDVAKVSVVEKRGAVALYIIPYGQQKMPIPTSGLKKTVSAYIGARSPATISVTVDEPEYLSVSLEMTIELTEWEYATAIKHTITETLDRFLHPVTGGVRQTGWAFGTLPALADTYRLLSGIEGIDKISTLTVALSHGKNYSVDNPEMPIVGKDTIICSGTHTIKVLYKGGE
ncbi:baseplate J/gp47 family protein [Sulfurovum mangrovi]|uniref:baseplate J/gp47 family protein n=1 Tax=Sulfurovum mangrovi TaxID=2893889 RepID=UPI001E4D19A2|nr:baseplate J/gp47 family protein [Sulfurovum mangrovi]UFH59985.1 baseplate J/gp47 family protein [Sulfurovum mangrovi]